MKLPQLSLRELFLLVVIAAMGCGWWVDRSRLAGDIQTLFEIMRRETPWLVESETPDWATNMMRQEAKAKREAIEAQTLSKQSP